MSQRDSSTPELSGSGLEEAVTLQSTRFLHRPPSVAGSGGDINSLRDNFEFECSRQLPAKRLIVVRFRSEEVVEMGECDVERWVPALTELEKNMNHGH
jgi:hypothetical protein